MLCELRIVGAVADREFDIPFEVENLFIHLVVIDS